MIDVVLLGCGRWGTNHLHTLCKLRDQGIISSVTVVDPNPKSIHGADNYSETMDGVYGDLAIIATPSHMHTKQANQLLSEGFNVLVEKPLGYSEKDAAEVLALANENGRVLGVGLLLRFHPGVAIAKKLIANGTLGRLESMRFVRRTKRPPSNSSGVVVEALGVHAIDLVCHLMGDSEPSALYTEGDATDCRIIIEFPHAIEAIIDVAWLANMERRYLKITGSNATLRIDLDVHDKVILIQNDDEMEIKCETSISPLEAEIRHMITCVKAQLNGKTWSTIPSPGAALRGVRWTERAKDSLPDPFPGIH